MSYGVVQGTGVVAAAGGAIIAGTATANGAVSFANSNGVTFGVSGNTVTATVNPGPAAGIGGIIAGTQTLTSQSLNFVNSNGITFGLSNSTNLTASFNSTGFAGTGTTFAGANISGSMTLNTAGLNLSLSGATGGTGGAFTGINISVAGQTSVGGIQTLNFAQANGVSFSFNTANFNLYAQAPPMSISGNTSGTPALMNTGTWVIAGGPNITLSQVLNSVTISGATAIGQPVNFSAGTTSGNLGSVVFSNSPTVSFGLSGSTITGSAAGGGGGANTLTGYGTGNTTQNTSGTLPLSSFVVSGDGIVSAGFTGNTLVISGPQTAAATLLSAGMSSIGNTSGNTGIANAQLVLAGGPNITLSGSTTGGSMTITISGGAGGGGGAQTLSVYGQGNTTNISSGTVNATSMMIAGYGALSVGVSGGSIQLSDPSTSSLAAVSGLSVSVTGSTISLYPMAISRSLFPVGQLTPVTNPGNASLSIQYLPLPNLLSISRLDQLVALSVPTAATPNTAAIAISEYAIIYSRIGNTLSSMSSGSTQQTLSWASNNAGQAIQLTANAIRPISVPINAVMTPGEYFVGFNIITATSSMGTATTSFVPTMSVLGGNQIMTSLGYNDMAAGSASATANNTNQYSGMGIYSVAVTGAPAAISLSAINATGSALSAANYAMILRNI